MKKCLICGLDRNNQKSFHSFPAHPAQRLLWLRVFNLSDEEIQGRKYVCDKHFLPEDFETSNEKIRKLRKFVIPSQNLLKTSTRDRFKKCLICGSDTSATTNGQLSYFRFPKNKIQRDVWKKTLGIAESTYVAKAVLCSKHFIVRKGRKLRLKLRPDEELIGLSQSEEKPAGRSHNSCVLCGVRSGDECSYHVFPKSIEQREKWISACQLSPELFSSSRKLRLCSNHFKDEDFTNLFNPRSRLKVGVVPSIFDRSNNNVEFQETLDIANVDCTDYQEVVIDEMPEEEESTSNSDITSTPNCNIISDSPIANMISANLVTTKKTTSNIHAPHFPSSRLAGKEVLFLRLQLMKQKNQNLLLRRKLRFARNKIQNLNSVIEHLKSYWAESTESYN